MGVNIGSSAISAAKIGSQSVNKMLLGVDVVFGGGGGGGAYVAKAFQFGGNTTYKNNSLVAADGSFYSGAFWWRASEYNFGVLAVGDPENAYINVVAFSGTGQDPAIVCDTTDESSEFSFYNESDPTPALMTWHSAVFCGSTNFGVGLKQGILYVDRVKVAVDIADLAEAFSMVFNGIPFWIGSNGVDFLNGAFADIRLMPNTNLLVDGDIPSETLDLFVTADNKPVDPATATAVLGDPCVLFSSTGDASSLNNTGTGGSFVLDGDPLTNATTSPSD